MAPLMTPGLQFYAEQIDSLKGGPQRNELYVVCKDGSIQSTYEPTRPIGWELIEDGDEWFYRVTHMNHPRKRCMVMYHSRVEDPPSGNRHKPQKAEITEQKDTGDEVSSKLAKIAKFDPLLAQCAAIVDNPVQTDAMAKFAEGKMSYAEMRGLCG